MNLISNIFQKGIDFVSDTAKTLHDKAPESPKMAWHYFGLDNDPYEYPVEKLRETVTIRNAEKINQDRLLDALSKPGKLRKKVFQSLVTTEYQDGRYSLDDMKDGELFGLDDYTDADRRSQEVFHNGDYDTFWGLGSFKMRTRGNNLQFKKTSRGILPYGYADHEISDSYDFDGPQNSKYSILKNAEDLGLAERYPVKARWRTRPFGIINIKDSKIDKSNITWE